MEFITYYNLSLKVSTTSIEVSPKLLLLNALLLPKFSSKIAPFFQQCKSRNNKSYIRIHFIHSSLLEKIIEDLKDELLYINFAIYSKVLKYWDTSVARWIIYFDPRYNLKDLAIFLSDSIKKIVKFNPIFTFRAKRVYNSSNKSETKPKKSLIKKKKKKEELLKAFYIEDLNKHKGEVVSALKKIFESE